MRCFSVKHMLKKKLAHFADVILIDHRPNDGFCFLLAVKLNFPLKKIFSTYVTDNSLLISPRNY